MCPEARVVMQRDGSVHVGIDNQTTVTTFPDITEHFRKWMEAIFKDESGGLILGGKTSPLHWKSQSGTFWPLVKNEDLLQSIEEAVLAKGPRSQPASQPASNPASQPISKQASQPASQPNEAWRGWLWRCCRLGI